MDRVSQKDEIPLDLDRFEATALAAQAMAPGPYTVDWLSDDDHRRGIYDITDANGEQVVVGDNGCEPPRGLLAEYVAGTSPDVVLRLIALARAATRGVPTASEGKRMRSLTSGTHADPIPMERVFWQPPDGPMMTAEVPRGVPFVDVGVKCWKCTGSIIQRVDRGGLGVGHYMCSAPHRHDIPEVYLRNAHGGRAIDVYENGARLDRIEGSEHTLMGKS